MELKTDRLYIRRMREDDCKAMKNIFIDFNHSPYAKYERPLPVRDDKVGLLVKKFACSNLFFVVSLLGSKKLIG